MTITRLSKDNYTVSCSGYTFTIVKRSFSQYWFVCCKELKLQRLCDDLSEAIDYIDFIMLY